MYKTYSIDDTVRYTSINNIDYLVSKSEVYTTDEFIQYERHELTVYIDNSYSQNKIKVYYFSPKMFLEPIRPETQFVNRFEEVQTLVEEIFFLMLGKRMPNFSITICTKEELMQIHSRFGSWNGNIQGFAFNKQIFVKNNNLDELLLTIGHEIGHVYTKSLTNKHDEEAKAFSFAIEWAKTIKKHNIGNLSNNIVSKFNPAHNGLHDISFFFVQNLIDKGLKPMQIHSDLVRNYISVFNFYN